uniref:rhamnogalacturonidase n=1 Tax=Pseudopedobacter sp. TaxID=1936787 RepID=UPI00333EB5F2
MRNNLKIVIILLFVFVETGFAREAFPNGEAIPEWFKNDAPTDINKLGKHYKITDFGVVNDSTVIQTELIQSVIDKAHQMGGGVVIIPRGTFLSGSLFFRPKTHLYLEEGATLKGSDDISNFRLLTTRIEGQTVKYFAALVNADQVDGFTVSGKGTLNGNGLRYWKSFWLRRQFNPQCTNMDEMRPRILYVSNSNNVRISGIKLINSPFWTSHFYKCEYLRLTDLHIFAPEHPVKAPSSDAIDLDACKNVHIKNCYLSVNDDAIALKGGKGPFADNDKNNGANSNIIIEDNKFGFCHSALTCGSESIHSYNIIFRRNSLDGAKRLLQLKMRPDTPQLYENILVEDVTGNVGSVLFIKPWTQFFDLKGEKGIKMSYARGVKLKNINLESKTMFDIQKSDQYVLSDFSFENLVIKEAKKSVITEQLIQDLKLKNVKI